MISPDLVLGIFVGLATGLLMCVTTMIVTQHTSGGV